MKQSCNRRKAQDRPPALSRQGRVKGWMSGLALALTVNGGASLVFAAAPAAVKPCVVRIRHVAPEDNTNAYPMALLQMALAKTAAQYGPCQVQMVDGNISTLRNIRMVQQGELDASWHVATVEREKELRPILIPIFQGLHGYRVMIIRKGEEARYAKVQTLDDLRQLKAGQMHGWQSTELLLANKLPTEIASSFDSLFNMLVNRRFDYLPRALHEPVVELRQRSTLPLTIEPALMLHYFAPDYFFVRIDAVALAERLRLGLERGIADGTRDSLRERIVGVAQLFRQLNVKKRRVIEMENPTLPSTAPLSRSELWLNINSF